MADGIVEKPDKEVPLPGPDLLRAIEAFFKWADAAIRKAGTDQKVFRRRLGVPSPDYTHWKKAKWGKKNPLTQQLRVSCRLLAVLSYDGRHVRFSAKGEQKVVRGDWKQLNVPEKTEWVQRTTEAIDLLQPYHQDLCEWKMKSEMPELTQYVQTLLKSSEYREAIIDSVLGRNYGEKYDIEFKTAKSLDITGTNLRRIASKTERHIDDIKNVLNRGGEVRVLMHHPDNVDACKYAMIQEFGPDEKLDRYIHDLVRENLRTFCEIRAEANKTKNGKMLIRTLDYTLAFGLDVINGNDPSSGVIYVRFYPLPRMQEKLEDKPIIRLEYGNGFWYGFFKRQFDHHWYNREEGGFAEDLPEDYHLRD